MGLACPLKEVFLLPKSFYQQFSKQQSAAGSVMETVTPAKLCELSDTVMCPLHMEIKEHLRSFPKTVCYLG